MGSERIRASFAFTDSDNEDDEDEDVKTNFVPQVILEPKVCVSFCCLF